MVIFSGVDHEWVLFPDVRRIQWGLWHGRWWHWMAGGWLGTWQLSLVFLLWRDDLQQNFSDGMGWLWHVKAWDKRWRCDLHVRVLRLAGDNVVWLEKLYEEGFWTCKNDKRGDLSPHRQQASRKQITDDGVSDSWWSWIIGGIWTGLRHEATFVLYASPLLLLPFLAATSSLPLQITTIELSTRCQGALLGWQ